MIDIKSETIDTDKYTDTLNELAKFIIASKYARHDDKLGRREVWEESTNRILSMHMEKFGYLDEESKDKIRWAFDKVRDKVVMPSMRMAQYAGPAISHNNARGFNCSVRHIDSIRSFAEVFFLLLSGCGVGIGLSRKHLNRLPHLIKSEDKTGSVLVYAIDDTIEGWADSLEVLLLSYFQNNPFSGRKIIFDYSKIRPKGAKLKIGGGKAPGYIPLKNAHLKIRALLEDAVESRGDERIRSIDCYDILMHASDAVLSGGVRRSATIVVFEPDDHDMMNAKTGEWYVDNPQRARSNNTVIIDRDKIDFEEFAAIFNRTKEWGEPGFLFGVEDQLVNPCSEISFIPITKDGQCGVQMCNLTSVNGAKINSVEDWIEAVEAATIIGTLQASYTDFHYLSDASKELTDEEALLGVSMTAMFANPDVTLNPENQKRVAQHAVETNIDWAKRIGINPAARVTAIKPEGSGSLAYGTMMSGIHPAHSKFMFRRVTANKVDPVYQFFKMMNPMHCEESVSNPNGTDDIITFPIVNPDNAILKEDLDAITHLEIIKSTQQNYIIPGTSPSNTKNVYHNVSCTVIVKEDEWEEVARYLFENREFFTAVSFIPDSGDIRYVQAPMQAVKTQEDFEKFTFLLNNFFPIDYTLIQESDDMTSLSGELACSGPIGCEIV